MIKLRKLIEYQHFFCHFLFLFVCDSIFDFHIWLNFAPFSLLILTCNPLTH